MDSLLGYGSDAEGSGEEDNKDKPQVSAPVRGGLLASLPKAGGGGGLGLPPEKKRRTLEIGRPKAPVKGSDSEDDDDAKPLTSKPKNSGLLSFLPAPKNEVSNTAYEDAEKRKKERAGAEEEGKKLSKAQMAAALFEKQKQDNAAKRAQGGAASDDIEDGGDYAEHGGGEEAAPQRQVVDPNWAAAWDDTHQAYYYYHTISGATQWEAPLGFDTSSLQAPQQEALPEELQREIAAEEKLLHEGEKHVQYKSAVAQYHTPMASMKGKPTQLERRKHQITDVLAMAAANELEYLDKAATGRRSSAQVRQRYGW